VEEEGRRRGRKRRREERRNRPWSNLCVLQADVPVKALCCDCKVVK